MARQNYHTDFEKENRIHSFRQRRQRTRNMQSINQSDMRLTDAMHDRQAAVPSPAECYQLYSTTH